MSNYERLQKRKELIRKKLSTVKLPSGSESSVCWSVGSKLNISGVTVKNYLNGKISDGYLAEEILFIIKKTK